MKAPDNAPPQCATKSISRNPGKDSSQSAKVRTGTRALIFFRTRRFRRRPALLRTGTTSRSMIAALTERTRSRTWGCKSRWPCRSIASTRLGRIAFNRFPQFRSEASQATTNASRTASS